MAFSKMHIPDLGLRYWQVNARITNKMHENSINSFTSEGSKLSAARRGKIKWPQFTRIVDINSAYSIPGINSLIHVLFNVDGKIVN